MVLTQTKGEVNMSYLVETTLNGRPQIQSGHTLGEDLDLVRDLYSALVKVLSKNLESSFPGMVIQIPLKPTGTLLEGVRIMANDGQGGHQGDVHTVELHSV